MLWKSQPGYFNREGDDVGKQLEEWLEKMDDHFPLAYFNQENKAMMGRFKLEKSAKLWWQDHYCEENRIDPGNATWEYISTHLAKDYQSYTYKIKRLNKFLDCTQGKDNLDKFYQRFLKLLKCAPLWDDTRGEGCLLCFKAEPSYEHSPTIPEAYNICRCLRFKQACRGGSCKTCLKGIKTPATQREPKGRDTSLQTRSRGTLAKKSI